MNDLHFGQSSRMQHDQSALNWHALDWEERLGFSSGRFTSVNTLFSLLLALVASVLTFVGLHSLIPDHPIARMFIERGFTPYLMVLLFYWSCIIILLKWSKLRIQRRALELTIVPPSPEFVLSSSTVQDILDRMQLLVDDPRKFLLLNRIRNALSNLKNLGRVTDVDDILHSQAEIDESVIETSYSLVRGFIWAIPVLGFIGTVMGLSIAIGGFGEVLAKTADPSQLADSLKVVTGGLATAFETTLVALLFALILQLVLTFLHKSEEEFLDECSEYCQQNIINKLKIMPFETEAS